MPAIQLSPDNRASVQARLAAGDWVVACLCAAWCDVCTEFRPTFERLAAEHPDKLLLWIDIEDEAEVVGDFDIENFPTLLIQQGSQVSFFGPVEAEAGRVGRLVAAQTRNRQAGSGSAVASPSTSAASSAAEMPDLQARLAAALSSGHTS